VEEEATMTLGEVMRNLGFGEKGLPFSFNQYRHTAGFSPWNPEHRSLFEVPQGSQPSPGIDALSLHSHQLSGVHAVIRRVFTKTPNPNNCPGMLIADEVGLGKTFEACTILAFLSELGIKQSKKLSIPPMISMSPLFLHSCGI
jgi:hypothetical protein